MIKFHDLPVNEKGHDALVREMTSCGYDRAEAQRLADAAAAIAIATLRGLDEKVMAASTDETDRTVIQQIVLQQLAGSCSKGLEVNAIEHFFKMLRSL